MRKRIFSALLAAALFLCLTGICLGVETEPREIYTVQDLMDMEKEPEGSYILMADLDLTDIPWKPLDFSGSLDGNGHAILNLTLSQPGTEKVNLSDEDDNGYEAAVFGLFGILRNANISNLTLINVRTQVEWEDACTLGALAGYMENSNLTDCQVTGTLELRCGGWMSCLGGLVGYGSGAVRRCDVNTTLISVDTDVQSMGEEYFGGVYAAGFISVYDTGVQLDGYISEHGYIHSGGIAGMFTEYPMALGQKGHIKDNTVSGQITFFEDNDDRLALCKALLGLARVNRYYLDGNTSEAFKITEVKEYDQELRPEKCAEPIYSVRVAEPGCHHYGFTEYTCDGCGYTFRDQYTCYAHTVTEWEVKKPATRLQEGQSVGKCECGLQFTRTDPKLEPAQEEMPAEPEQTQTEETACAVLTGQQEPCYDLMFYAAVGFFILLLVSGASVVCVLIKRKK